MNAADDDDKDDGVGNNDNAGGIGNDDGSNNNVDGGNDDYQATTTTRAALEMAAQRGNKNLREKMHTRTSKFLKFNRAIFHQILLITLLKLVCDVVIAV